MTTFDSDEFLKNVLTSHSKANEVLTSTASVLPKPSATSEPRTATSKSPDRKPASAARSRSPRPSEDAESRTTTTAVRESGRSSRRTSRSRSRDAAPPRSARDPSRESRRKESHRSRSRESTRRRDKSRESTRRRERSRESTKRRERSRSRDERRHRRSERSRSRDRDRRSRRASSRSRSRDRRRSRERRRASRSRSRDRYRRTERRRTRSPPRARPRPPPPPRPARSPAGRSSVPTIVTFDEEMDRLDRTVGVLQLAARVRSKDLYDFFESSGVGKVNDARIVKDTRSGVSKGIAYVEFEKLESVEKATALTGTKIQGQPCIVQRCDHEKQLLIQQLQSGAYHQSSANEANLRKIYAVGIHDHLTQDEIRPIFEAFGPVNHLELHYDKKTGKFRGIATMTFRHPPDAKKAIEAMNGFELAGKTIRVGWIRERAGPIVVGMEMESLDEDGGGGGGGGGGAALGMNSISRQQLMAKLTRAEDNFPMGPSSGDGGPMSSMHPRNEDNSDFSDDDDEETLADKKKEITPPRIPAQQPSRNCLLKNMFDPLEESGTEWVDEIRDDVLEECRKFGQVVHIYVDRDNPEGCVYLRFAQMEQCRDTVNALNGRWFNKKQLSATFIVDAIYEARFPDARRV